MVGASRSDESYAAADDIDKLLQETVGLGENGC